ncbi:hypothetical protein [Virgibacillus senegalensis]|uniref:hypothetical protein n=1 Tax=Virgibacillus senegalensis TaxID=1499679 RepID=UPI00069E70A8|nr:hypothetical protein [Virgibacillus senegalensis]
MVDSFLDLMLGNFRMISSFYFQYQSVFNTLIVGAAVYQLFFRNKQTNENNRAVKDRKDEKDESTQPLRSEGSPL